MLDLFRRQAGNMLGTVIVTVIIVVFVFNFGRQSHGWGRGVTETKAASVYGDDIQETSFHWTFYMIGGDSVPIEEQKQMKLRESTLEGLIERQLLAQQALKLGLSISEDDVDDQILKGHIYISRPIDSLLQESRNLQLYYKDFSPGALLTAGFLRSMDFTKNGVFQYNEFRTFVLHQLGSNLKVFKEEQRLELLSERMRQVITSNVHVGENEAFDRYFKENLKIRFSYVRFIPLYFQENIQIDPKTLAQWTEDNKEKIAQYYQQNVYQYTNLDRQGLARHILFKTNEKATDAEKAEKRALAQKALSRLKRNEDFTKVAREMSEDTTTARKGGLLGWTPRGRMDPAFEEALFKLTPGNISDIVSTPEGFHIIKVESFREGDVPLETAKPEIAERLYREQQGTELARQKAQEILGRLQKGESLESLAPTNPNSEADPLAPVNRQTPLFARQGNNIPDIGEDSRLAQTVFQLTLDSPTLPEPMKVGNDFYIIKLTDRITPTREEFEKDKDRTVANLLDRKRIDALGAYLRGLLKQAEDDKAIWRNAALLAYPRTRESAEEADQNKAKEPEAPMVPPASSTSPSHAKDGGSADNQSGEGTTE